jgi:7-cyano-7-deazaguanine synthase
MQFVVEVSSLKQLGGNALTDNAIPVMKGSADDGIPDTFVPGRNLIFMTLAAAWAWPRNIRHLVTGVAQTDYSGYPDCRADTLQALNQSINLGMETNFQIHTPLMNLSKAETVTLAMECSAMEAMKYSHTCYNGEFPPCGTCPSCILRAKGFKEAGIIDPLFTR